MARLIPLLLAIHVAAGTLALAVAPVAMLTAKGGPAHALEATNPMTPITATTPRMACASYPCVHHTRGYNPVRYVTEWARRRAVASPD